MTFRYISVKFVEATKRTMLSCSFFFGPKTANGLNLGSQVLFTVCIPKKVGQWQLECVVSLAVFRSRILLELMKYKFP